MATAAQKGIVTAHWALQISIGILLAIFGWIGSEALGELGKIRGDVGTLNVHTTIIEDQSGDALEAAKQNAHNIRDLTKSIQLLIRHDAELGAIRDRVARLEVYFDAMRNKPRQP